MCRSLSARPRDYAIGSGSSVVLREIRRTREMTTSESNAMKRIDVLYFSGCPNHAPAVDMVREVVGEMGVDAEIREVEVQGPDDANRLRFLGSPTIQVDGRDIDPSAWDRMDFGFSCRTYDGHGLPRKELLIEALRCPNGEAIDGPEACCAEVSRGLELARRQSKTERAGALAAAGALGAAVVASACCWLPLLLIAFGASAGGLGVVFETTRPYFLAVAAVLLAGGFYYAYLRKEQCEPGSACERPNPRLRRFNRAMLWVAAAGVAAFALFPYYVAAFVPASASVQRSFDTPVETITLDVVGMSCEGCAGIVRNELMKVPGVLDAQVIYEQGRAVVSVDGDSPPAPESLLAAVEKAGYRGSIASDNSG